VTGAQLAKHCRSRERYPSKSVGIRTDQGTGIKSLQCGSRAI